MGSRGIPVSQAGHHICVKGQMGLVSSIETLVHLSAGSFAMLCTWASAEMCTHS